LLRGGCESPINEGKGGERKKTSDEEAGMEVTVFPSDSHKLTIVN